MRDTQIMATLTDVRATESFIGCLHAEGMDAVRINSAHVTPEVFRRMVEKIRAVSGKIKILMDTKGPEVRTSETPVPLELRTGDDIEIAFSKDAFCADKKIYTAVEGLDRCVECGSVILIDDGAIAVKVRDVKEGIIYGRVERGGKLDSRKTIAIVNGELPPLPPVSDRDRLMLEAAVDLKIDMIAHSFVRSAADVAAVRSIIADSGIKLYAKIECRSAMKNLEEIVSASDGILVARGDLGTAYNLSEIPALQYEIMQHCRKGGKPAIVSTQIMQSMITSQQPTRAEMSDIALSVMEGADWLLLCGETAQGDYPAECVAFMRRTIESVESNGLRCKLIG